MIPKNAEIHLVDAMGKSYKRVDRMLDENAPDDKIKKEIDLFKTMEQAAHKYNISFNLKQM